VDVNRKKFGKIGGSPHGLERGIGNYVNDHFNDVGGDLAKSAARMSHKI
jgi:hypothetical protein